MVLFVLFFCVIVTGDKARDNPVYHALMIRSFGTSINRGFAQSLPQGYDRLLDSS
jgi:hypothetical protein